MNREIQVEAYRSGETPEYEIVARTLLPKIREFYQDPDHLKAFQEWKKQREAKMIAMVEPAKAVGEGA